MHNAVLYGTAVMSWGLTAFAIKLQLAIVEPEMGVAYRFGLGAVLLLLWCLWRRRSLRFSLRQHLFIALQGVLLFSFTDIAVYNAIARVTSGLVPLVFSLLPIATILIGAPLIGLRVRPRVVVAAVVGLTGIAMVFSPELDGFDLSSAGLVGLGLALAGVLSQALGNITAARNFGAGLPVLETTAIGMVYGAGCSFGISLALGGTPTWDFSVTFIGGFLWVAVLGTAVAFMCYLILLDRIGPDRVAYIVLLVPVVSLTISSVFEDYEWTAVSLVGAAVVLAGSVVALGKTGRAEPVGATRKP